jgi:hypothetical protein
MDTLNTPIHDRPLSWFGTGSSIKSGEVKLVLWAQTFLFTEVMQKCVPDASKMSTITYNQANSGFIKNAIILKIIRNECNLQFPDFVPSISSTFTVFPVSYTTFKTAPNSSNKLLT